MSLMEKSTDDEKCPNRKKQGTVTPALRLSKEVVGCIPEIAPRFDATYRFVTCKTLASVSGAAYTNVNYALLFAAQVSLAHLAIWTYQYSHSPAHFVNGSRYARFGASKR